MDNENINNEDINDDEFIEDLYTSSEPQVNEIYEEQDKSKKSLLDKIAKIILIYTIVDAFLNLKRKQRLSIYNKLSLFTLASFKKQSIHSEKKVKNILKNTAKKSANHYNINLVNQDAIDIINKRYKGMNFSERIWGNNNDISQKLHKEFDDFLRGKTSINDIGQNIEKTFETSKDDVKRLVDTEISRVHQEVFKKYCKENNVEEIIYKASLCHTCSKCRADHNKPFKIDEAPEVPRHPRCRCYWTINSLPKSMNLQLFGFVADKDRVLSLIKDNQIDKNDFNKFYTMFNDKFKGGIKTPIETINNSNDRFYHIVYRHSELMCEEGIEQIIETLSNPQYIKEAIDKNGRKSYGYIKTFNGRTLMVVAKNDIITAYYPGKNYLKNKIGSWRLIWGKE